MELILDSGTAKLRVTALTDRILRLRLTRAGSVSEDASWAVPAPRRAARAQAHTDAHSLRTAALTVAVDPSTLAVTVTDPEGRLIHADAPRPFAFDGEGFALFKQLGDKERIHGMGDKTGSFDRRGASFVNWTTDHWGFGTATDPTYKAIPFYLADGGEAGCHGLFLDNTWRSWFDFGHRRAGQIEIAAEGGAIDYYLIHGPSLAEVTRGYAWLTGPAPLPPRWALGFQQCRWSYETAAEVRALADRFKAEAIPLDVIWLDIHFQDRNRPFTVDAEAFPDLAALVAELKAQHIRTVVITDLHVAQAPDEGYAPYDQGTAGDHFLRRADGSVYSGEVWPGPSVFPEFTRPSSRASWGSLFGGFVGMGVAGFWNDMNEPAIFTYPSKTMPADVVHRIEGDGFAPRSAPHAEIHNVYGMLNTRATAEGLAALRPNARAFVMTRASYAGGQRYAATWTGDNVASWEHLRLSIVQLLSLGLSGFVWSGCDIGGFTGGPSPDLLTRWTQVGAFMPIMRAHAATGTPRAEPWVDGEEHTALRKAAIEWRYRLLPYCYALARAAEEHGDPVMRPLAWDYPEAAAASHVDLACSFTFGPSLLIALSPKPESPQPYDVCLPAGGWYDFWSGVQVEPAFRSDCGAYEVVSETPRIDRLPVFARAGAIIALQPLVQSTLQEAHPELTLHVYPGASGEAMLYDDDGESLDYRQGACFAQRASWDDAAAALTLDPPQGARAPWWNRIKVVIHGHSAARRVLHPDAAVDAVFDPAAQTLTVALKGNGETRIELA